MCNVGIFRNVKEVLVKNVNTPPPPPNSHPPWWSYDSMCNVCIFRNVKEVLVKNVNNTPPHPPPPPPLMIIRQHVQHVKNSKKSNSIPPFAQASFLKFATLPRDRKWHISNFQGRRISRMPKTTTPPHLQTAICTQIQRWPLALAVHEGLARHPWRLAPECSSWHPVQRVLPALLEPPPPVVHPPATVGTWRHTATAPVVVPRGIAADCGPGSQTIDQSIWETPDVMWHRSKLWNDPSYWKWKNTRNVYNITWNKLKNKNRQCKAPWLKLS